MAFQIKDFTSITLGEINHARAVTSKINDFIPGSVARTLMEAPAIEMEELYLQMFLGLRDAIPVSCFLSFGFDKRPARFAFGNVSISRPAPVTIDIPIAFGSRFLTADERVYVSTQDVVWRTGQDRVVIPVRAEAAGAAGNTRAGTIVASEITFGTGFVVSNEAIVNGLDEESDAEREIRFADYIKSLSRGTVVACRYAASLASVLDASGAQLEGVTRIGMTEVPGRVSIYVYSNIGVPSEALLLDGQRRIDGYRDDATGTVVPGVRSAGVQVDVLPMVERSIDLSIQVRMRRGYTLTPAVVQTLNDRFGSAIRAVPAGDILYLGDLTEYLLKDSAIEAIVPQSNENIICDVREALTPGALTISLL